MSASFSSLAHLSCCPPWKRVTHMETFLCWKQAVILCWTGPDTTCCRLTLTHSCLSGSHWGFYFSWTGWLMGCGDVELQSRLVVCPTLRQEVCELNPLNSVQAPQGHADDLCVSTSRSWTATQLTVVLMLSLASAPLRVNVTTPPPPMSARHCENTSLPRFPDEDTPSKPPSIHRSHSNPVTCCWCSVFLPSMITLKLFTEHADLTALLINTQSETFV